MRCPDELDLQSMFDEELNRYQAYLIKKHVANCRNCASKLATLATVVNVINQELPKISLPRVQVVNQWQKRSLVLTWTVTAIFVLLFGGGIFWQQCQSEAWSTEGELLDQYVTVYLEN